VKIPPLLLALALAPLAGAAPDVTLASVELAPLPPLADFLRMAERSPFSGRPAAILDENAGGAWELWGLMQISGKNYAILRQTESHQFLYLTEKTNSQGLRLASVDFNPDPRKETVTIEVNGTPTRLGYAAELLARKLNAYEKFDQTPISPSP
jgi:hypothetical protein